MDTKVAPSSKTTANGHPPAFPATKAQLYGATTRNYRPQPTRRRHGRSCCCSCCLWTTIAILVILLLAGLAGVVFYILYSPHRPVFTVTSLNLAYLNTTSSAVNSKLNLTITARNPNKKLIYIYTPSSITVLTNGVDIGEGTFPAFVHRTRNTTVLRSTIASKSQTLEGDEVDKLKSALKTKNGVPLTVRLDTKVRLKVGSVKTPRIGIRVTCYGIRVTVPAKGKPAVASTGKAKCKVETRIKIWRWTL